VAARTTARREARAEVHPQQSTHVTSIVHDPRLVAPGRRGERVAPIYLDYNATTPLDSAVADAMEPFLHSQFGNPSSAHAYGPSAHVAVERAPAQLAQLLGKLGANT
jgi:selenocysteine lyase/cysteine desulfurase